MARPVVRLPTWATSITGVARTVDPGAPRQGDGWDVDEEPPAGWWNWMWNNAGQWITFFDEERIRQYTSVALLKAETAHVTGNLVIVANKALFRYDSTSADTDDGSTVITPTDVGMGAGRWIAVRVSKNISDPIGAVDTTAVVLTAAYVAVHSFTTTYTLGDKVSLDVMFRAGIASLIGAGGSVEAYVNVSGPGGFTQDTEAVAVAVASALGDVDDRAVTFPILLPISTTGTYTISVMARYVTPGSVSAGAIFSRYRSAIIN